MSLGEIWLSVELGIKELLKPLFQTKIKPGDIVFYKWKGGEETVLILAENSRYKGIYHVLVLSIIESGETSYPVGWTTGRSVQDWYMEDDAVCEIIKAGNVKI